MQILNIKKSKIKNNSLSLTNFIKIIKFKKMKKF